MICVHCRKELDLKVTNVRYPLSGEVAHPRCVSFPSAAAMDELLVLRYPIPYKR